MSKINELLAKEISNHSDEPLLWKAIANALDAVEADARGVVVNLGECHGVEVIPWSKPLDAEKVRRLIYKLRDRAHDDGIHQCENNLSKVAYTDTTISVQDELFDSLGIDEE